MNNLLSILIILLLIIILLILARKETEEKKDEEIISGQQELKDKIFTLSKEMYEQLLNLRNELNTQIVQILGKTENLILDQVGRTLTSLGQTDGNIQKKMESLRIQLHQTLTDTVKNLTNTINGSTNQLTSNLDSKLEQLNKRLSDTTGLMKDLSLRIGEITRSTEELRKLNEELKNALTTPKLQGRTGELILENMLREFLPKEIYETQYRISSGDVVDVVIKIEDKLIPIDAKFPIDSYKKMVEASEEEYEKMKAEFIRNVKNHIEKITKYIQPEKGTFDFAFMYIPSETIFYSLLICEDKEGSLFNYAWSKKKILPVSPQSLFAYLRMILLGLKGKAIERNASYILKSVEGMSKTLENLRIKFERAATQLKYTRTNFEEAKDYLDKFENEFKSLAKLNIEESQLPENK
ncbi:MAG TPA: DNA recombination protein RmuC [Firmicutes bacterium]|nr:DNA recombination protein RmuC [Bacillota bacterium]